MKSLKSIMIEYAQEHGGGLPLSAQEICNAVVLWVQQYLNTTAGVSPVKVAEVDGVIQISLDMASPEFANKIKEIVQENFFNAINLADLFEGSETVIVDINEAGDKIEIHLDGEVVQKIQRSVLTPLQNPTEPKLPVLGVNGAIEWEPVSSFVGGGAKLYKHDVHLEDENGNEVDLYIYSTKSAPLTINHFLAERYQGIGRYVSGDINFSVGICFVDITDEDETTLLVSLQGFKSEFGGDTTIPLFDELFIAERGIRDTITEV